MFERVGYTDTPLSWCVRAFLFLIKWENKRGILKENTTYKVPVTLFMFPLLWSLPKLLAKPKSEIFGSIAPSSRILLALKSLYIILSLESWWRYSRPLAILQMILKRLGPSKSFPCVWSVHDAVILSSQVEHLHKGTTTMSTRELQW